MVLTQEQKLRLYKAGSYKFNVPPVCHASWTDRDWINYIDANGGWIIRLEI